jgi:tetratricopeptide (TPR) repeat protein
VLTELTPEQETAEKTQLATFASRISSASTAGMRSVNSAQASAPLHLPGRDGQESYERGLALKKSGLHKEALQHFSLAALDVSLTFKAMAQIGICLKSLGQAEEAVTAFQKSLQAQRGTSPDTLQVRYLLARTLESLGRAEDSLEEYHCITREDPAFKDVAERIQSINLRRQRSAQNDSTVTEGSWVSHLQRILGASK